MVTWIVARMVQASKKAAVAQITTFDKGGILKRISELAERRTLKDMSYSIRRLRQVPHLSDKNKKLSLQFSKDSRRLKRRCLFEFRFLPQYSGDRVKTWH